MAGIGARQPPCRALRGVGATKQRCATAGAGARLTSAFSPAPSRASLVLPRDHSSAQRIHGTIAFDGERSCGFDDRRDRKATNPIASTPPPRTMPMATFQSPRITSLKDRSAEASPPRLCVGRSRIPTPAFGALLTATGRAPPFFTTLHRAARDGCGPERLRSVSSAGQPASAVAGVGRACSMVTCSRGRGRWRGGWRVRRCLAVRRARLSSRRGRRCRFAGGRCRCDRGGQRRR